MDIQEIIKEKNKCFSYKNIAPIKEMLDSFMQHNINANININDTIDIDGEIPDNLNKQLLELLVSLKPWRKGPFKFFDNFIDCEWKSSIKYNLIEPFLDIKDKTIIDIGCNNGYYLFRMLEKKPKNIIGIDPSAIYYMQFALANHFIKSPITYELLGVEHIYDYIKHKNLKVDIILYLGVLYHRIDPIGSLKIISKSLQEGGTLILDSFIIDGDEEIALCPKSTYSKIPNIYFIPTINTMKNWLLRAGFEDIKVIKTSVTNKNEQRKTKWIDAQSLEHFIDEQTNLTVEGYPQPKRGYIICKKKSKRTMNI